MSMAIAYNMKKRRMASGGDVKGVHHPLGENRYARGQSAAGRYTRDKNEDSAKNMHEKTLAEMQEMRGQDRTNLAHGGEVDEFTKRKSAQALDRRDTGEPDYIRNARNPKVVVENEARKAKNGGHYAEGGEVCPTCNGRSSHDGMVDRIMSRYSEGGVVANDDDDGETDAHENNFDVLPDEDHLEEHETGANSGDEIGNHAEDEEEGDLVSRIMRSRSKRDRNPKPA